MDIANYLTTQGPWGGVSLVSIGVNLYLLKVVVGALKDNTIAITTFTNALKDVTGDK